MTKVVDLKEYKSQKALEEQIRELDRLGEAQFDPYDSHRTERLS